MKGGGMASMTLTSIQWRIGGDTAFSTPELFPSYVIFTSAAHERRFHQNQCHLLFCLFLEIIFIHGLICFYASIVNYFIHIGWNNNCKVATTEA